MRRYALAGALSTYKKRVDEGSMTQEEYDAKLSQYQTLRANYLRTKQGPSTQIVALPNNQFQQDGRTIAPTSATIPQQPVPSALPTINRPQPANAQQIAPQSSPTGMPSVIQLDSKAMEFVTKFGEFVNQLSQIKIPSVIEVKGGNHTVDVRVSGAAAFEALQEGVKGLINDAISDAMSTIHTQSLGVLGSPKSKNAKTKSGNQGENTKSGNKE
jgi:hypothetical protein